MCALYFAPSNTSYDKHKKMKSIIPVKALVLAAVVSLAFFAVPAFAQKNTALSDAEVASVAVVANQIDINYGEIARKKSKNP